MNIENIIRVCGGVFLLIFVLAAFRANKETGSIAMNASLIGSIFLLFGLFLIICPKTFIYFCEWLLNILR